MFKALGLLKSEIVFQKRNYLKSGTNYNLRQVNPYFLLYEEGLLRRSYPLSTPLKLLYAATFTNTPLNELNNLEQSLFNLSKVKVTNRIRFMNYLKVIRPRLKIFTNTLNNQQSLFTYKSVCHDLPLAAARLDKNYNLPRSLSFTNYKGPLKKVITATNSLHSTLVGGYVARFASSKGGLGFKKPRFVLNNFNGVTRGGFFEKLPYFMQAFFSRPYWRSQELAKYTCKPNLNGIFSDFFRKKHFKRYYKYVMFRKFHLGYGVNRHPLERRYCSASVMRIRGLRTTFIKDNT